MISHLENGVITDLLGYSWTPRIYEDATVRFIKLDSHEIQLEHPITGERYRAADGRLPFGWERLVTDDKQIIFVNHISQTTSFEDPRLATCAMIGDLSSNMQLRQVFDANSTADQVLHEIDLSGRTFLVIGGTNGLGAATVRALTRHGGHVIFTGRNVSAGNAISRDIQLNCGKSLADFVPLDLCSLDAVNCFAQRLLNKDLPISCLILNAGIFGVPYEKTTDGYETMFQVNVLSQLYLLLLLKPLLAKSAPSRVIFVSSESHRMSSLNPATLSESTLSPAALSYSSWVQYNNTKLCQVALSNLLQNLWGSEGIAFYALHPGNMIYTGITRAWWVWKLVFAAAKPFTKSLEQGIATIVYCATAKDLAKEGGRYWNNCWYCEPSRLALDPLLQKAVWNTCVKMLEERCGDKFHL